MVAALCQSAGIHIGTDLVGTHESNPLGHFEDLDFYRLHETILSENLRLPQGYEPFDSPLDISNANRSLACSIVSLRREYSIPWGWKDPRTILFLSFWQGILPELRFALVFRHPGEVASSLERRGECYFQDGGMHAFRHWYWYNKAAFDFCSQYPERLIVREAAEICQQPSHYLRDLGLFLGLDLTMTCNPCNPDLLQSRRISALPPTCEDLVERCEDLYNDLHRLAMHGRVAPAEKCSSLVLPVRHKVAIAIPVHSLPLMPHERASLAQLRHHLLCFDRFVISPSSLDVSGLGLPALVFEDHWFQSVATYSRLLLSQQFYLRFQDYDYILIHQLDALVFSSSLGFWCRQGFDYVGAPWFPGYSSQPAGDGLWATGNGGLSLRRVHAFLELLETPEIADCAASTSHPEDVFWSQEVPKLSSRFSVAPPSVSVRFSIESAPRYCFALNGNMLPFGCHYWHRIDPEFWEVFLVSAAKLCLPATLGRLLDSGGPGVSWLQGLSFQLLLQSVSRRNVEDIAQILTSDIDSIVLDAPPTAEGIRLLFDRLLGREPGQDWNVFWIGKHGARLSDVRRDLAIGQEFQERCEYLKNILLSMRDDN